MSTVGLTAQETSFPLENPFLWGSSCHMADPKSSWGYPHEASHNYGIKSSYTNPRVHAHHKDPPPLSPTYEKHKPSPKMSLPSHLSLSFTTEPFSPSPSEDKHILPLPQSVYRGSSPPQTPGRCSKPLPPIPLHTDTDTCTEQTTDNELESFTNTDESSCLLSDKVSKSSLQYGLWDRWSLRIQGQVNRGFCDYYHGPQSPRPIQTQQHQVQASHEAQERHEPLQQESPEIVIHPRQLDKTQKKVGRTQSCPPGSFNKQAFLNLQSHKRNTQNMYKPEVPPPIPPRLHKTEDYRRWSLEVSSGAYSDEDKPPKVPPRDPRGSSRTPSPKSLPLYINGEMPPTQSFAPDPKYVYRGLQRQNSEGSPCILPVIENGQKVSNTHYYLLDGPPSHNMDVSHSEWDYRNRKKAPVDFV